MLMAPQLGFTGSKSSGEAPPDPGLGYEPPDFAVVSGAGASATEVSPNVWELSSDSEYSYIKADADIGDFLLAITHDGTSSFLVGLYADDPATPSYVENYVEWGADRFGFEFATDFLGSVSYNDDPAIGTLYLHRSGSNVTLRRGGTSYADATPIDTATSDLNRLWASLDQGPPASVITVEFLPLP